MRDKEKAKTYKKPEEEKKSHIKAIGKKSKDKKPANKEKEDSSKADAIESVIEFTIPGKPMGKGRPRVMPMIKDSSGNIIRRARAITPKDTVSYENLIRLMFINSKKDNKLYFKDVYLSSEIDVYYPIPVSATKKNKEKMLNGEIRPRKPDIDNIEKVVWDALNKVAYEDDAYICESITRKYYTNREPYVRVRIKKAN